MIALSFTINLGAQPYSPYWLAEAANTTGATLESTFAGLTTAQINGTWQLEVQDHRNGNVGSVIGLKLWLGQGVKNRVGQDRGTGAGVPNADDAGLSHPTKPAFAPNSGVGPNLTLVTDYTLGAFSPYQNRVYMVYSTGGSIQVLYSDGVDGTGGQLWTASPTTAGTGFLPAAAVDPATGTLVVAFYSPQYDASGTRTTMMMTTAINMGDIRRPLWRN